MARKLTKRQQAFLDAYRELGFVQGAALQAGVSRELHYNALRVSKPYREAFSEIEQLLALRLEEEARRLALQGNPEPVYYGRKIVGYRVRPSEKLLIFLLQANNPEKFGHPGRRPRKKRKPDRRPKSRSAAAAPKFSWKRLRRSLRNQSLSGGSGRKPTCRVTPPPPAAAMRHPETTPAPRPLATPHQPPRPSLENLTVGRFSGTRRDRSDSCPWCVDRRADAAPLAERDRPGERRGVSPPVERNVERRQHRSLSESASGDGGPATGAKPLHPGSSSTKRAWASQPP